MSAEEEVTPTAVEQRLTELEIKASYADDLLDTLHTLVLRQQQQIDILVRELQNMRHQQGDASGPGFRSLRDEIPPHY